MTPPSRITTGGCSMTAACNRLACWSCRDSSLPSDCSLLSAEESSCCCMAGRVSRESLNVARSRGLAVFRATLASMRSMSPMAFSSACNASYRSSANRLSIVSWRNWIMFRSRTGWLSQRRNRRLPMLVEHWSSSPSRVLLESPLLLVSISRLRRVAASIMM